MSIVERDPKVSRGETVTDGSVRSGFTEVVSDLSLSVMDYR